MGMLFTKRKISVLGAVCLLCFVVFHAGTGSAARKKFVGKDCLDCHTKFADKYFGMKNVHAVVKEKKCERLSSSARHRPQTPPEEDGERPLFRLSHEGKDGNEQAERAYRPEDAANALPATIPMPPRRSHLLSARARTCAITATRKSTLKRKRCTRSCRRRGAGRVTFPTARTSENLLVKAETPLCLSCHDSGNAAFMKAHGNYPVQEKSCTVCHNPHSSDQPKLMKESAHNPVVTGSCDMCHNAPTSGKPFALKQEDVERSLPAVPFARRSQGGGRQTARALQGRHVRPVSQPPFLREPETPDGAREQTLFRLPRGQRGEGQFSPMRPLRARRVVSRAICRMPPRTTICSLRKAPTSVSPVMKKQRRL